MTAKALGRDRAQTIKDLDYFCGEVIRRLERLAHIEPSGEKARFWRQAAALSRKIRTLCRTEIQAGKTQP